MALKDQITEILVTAEADVAQKIVDLVGSQPPAPTVDVAGAIELLQQALAKLQGQ